VGVVDVLRPPGEATGEEIRTRSSAAAVRAYIGRSWFDEANGGGLSYWGGKARSRKEVDMATRGQNKRDYEGGK
jgi:hypothetical protein